MNDSRECFGRSFFDFHPVDVDKLEHFFLCIFSAKACTCQKFVQDT